MGFDLKDITELLPFIGENIEKCVYIIVVCLFFGFLFGRFVGRIDTKSKKEMKAEIEKYKNENLQLNSEITLYKLSQNNSQSPLTSLTNLGQLLHSKDGEVELSALIEVKYNQNKTGSQPR